MMLMKKYAIACVVLGSSFAAHAFMPQAGTWAVTSEVNGKPGRGFGLDVQNSTLVMQMYAYDPSGNPTFYLSAGTISGNNYSGQLNKYRGGRYFGSGDMQGREDGSAGTVRMRFVSGTQGFIQFPNEPEKAINRFNFAYDTSAESLRGAWVLSAIHQTTPSLDKVDFFGLEVPIKGTSFSSGAMASANYQYSCESLTSGPNAGLVMCAKFSPSGDIQRVNFFQLSVNEGEGWAGASSATANDVLFARRVRNTTGDYTGIYYKSQAIPGPIDPEKMSRALQAAAEMPVGSAPTDEDVIEPTLR